MTEAVPETLDAPVNPSVYIEPPPRQYEKITTQPQSYYEYIFDKKGEGTPIGDSPRFEIPSRRVIGRGAMGSIRQGIDIHTGRKVAIKLVNALNENVDMSDPEVRGNFLKSIVEEAKAQAKMQNPFIANIISLTQVPDETGEMSPAIVMEWVEGEPLSNYNIGLDVDDICEITKGIANAIESGAKRKVFHRDLKPSNIIYKKEKLDSSNTVDRQVKVIDFGISSRVFTPEEELAIKKGGTVKGTLAYMAPEDFYLEPIQQHDKRSEIYQLGLIAYFMLVGEHYFKGKDYEEMKVDRDKKNNQIQFDDEAIRKIKQRYGFDDEKIERLQLILAKATRQNKERRYQDAEDFAYALEAVLKGKDLQKAA